MTGIVAAGKSDAGLKRSNNEDVFIAEPGMGLLSVSDGMGGAASGEVASHIFAETIREIFSKSVVQSEHQAIDLIKDAFRLANEQIFDKAREKAEHRGMGCTAELLFFFDQKYYIGHVGDSRTYLFREGKLKQVTHDHSLVQDQIDKGLITEHEARNHSYRNVILRAVGTREVLEVDLIRGKALPGDAFMLCSDGLTDMVDDSSIQRALSDKLPVDQKVDELIELAKSAGGYDNITVVLCEVVSPK